MRLQYKLLKVIFDIINTRRVASFNIVHFFWCSCTVVNISWACWILIGRIWGMNQMNAFGIINIESMAIATSQY